MTKKKSKEKPKNRLVTFFQAAMIALELAGIGFGLYLTYIKFNSVGAACNINTTFDCGTVANSKYSAIFGVPIAWLGVLTYIVAMVFSIMGFFPDKGRVYQHTPIYLLVISIWCVLLSVVLACISSFILKTYCTNCIGMYFVNFGMLMGSWILSGGVEGGRWAPIWYDFRDGVREVKVWFAPAGMAVIVVGSYFFFTYVTFPTGKGVFRGVDLSPYPAKGNPNAPVQIVDFSDMKCPWCKKVYDVIEESRASYGDKYIVYFIHFPLEEGCNTEVKRSIHAGACMGAYAAYCAQKQGKFWEMADQLFGNQDVAWDANVVIDYAKKEGLDTQRFAACLVEPETKAFIAANVEVAKKNKITRTPTLFFNGVEVTGVTGGKQAFVKELQKAITAGASPAAAKPEQPAPSAPPAQPK